ncbi:hypothetical protein LY78DRAFT_700247 [Colletotrichum sublineola]|nr:hypothetical protein LY78DRAFT_700247 [Colletotrichum sublineola]
MSLSKSDKAETWVWFCLVITTVTFRYISQYIVRKQKFLREIPMEDILMVIIVLTYTTSLVFLYLYLETSSDMDHRNITSEYESFVARRLGILGVLLETALQTTLWGNKACLLLFYNRLSLLGIEHKFSVVISIFLGLSYVAIIVALYYGWCRPFSEYLVLHPQNDLVLVLIPVARISMLQMKIGK